MSGLLQGLGSTRASESWLLEYPTSMGVSTLVKCVSLLTPAPIPWVTLAAAGKPVDIGQSPQALRMASSREKNAQDTSTLTIPEATSTLHNPRGAWFS